MKKKTSNLNTQLHDAVWLLRSHLLPQSFKRDIRAKLAWIWPDPIKRWGNTRNALLCCETGLKLTIGITRPLMIRDQLHDLSATLQRTSCSR